MFLFFAGVPSLTCFWRTDDEDFCHVVRLLLDTGVLLIYGVYIIHT